MKNTLLLVLLFLVSNSIDAQQRIDGAFSFQTDPNKKYSLYIPSNYDVDVPHKLMLGFHPFNTSRWDAESWCDTLIAFAETNNLILACPDGGVDGQVDDAIDTAFTSVLLDSMEIWYNINPEKVYVMGFSWGGLTTYTYGLNHAWRFKGFIPIGAAINGTGPVNTIIANAANKPFYLVHGSFDSPSARFTPLRNALQTNNAIVEWNLMDGVGHTIDFPNRNQILTDAFMWVDSVNCSQLPNSVGEVLEEQDFFNISPNPLAAGNHLQLQAELPEAGKYQILVYDINGKQMSDLQQVLPSGLTSVKINATTFGSGIYFIQLRKNGESGF